MSRRSGRGRRSISTTMVLAFTVLVIVVTVLINACSFAYTRDQLQSVATDYTGQLISQVNAEIDLYVEYIKDLSDFVVKNASVAAYLEDENTALRAQAESILDNAARTRSEITTIALVSMDGRILFGDRTARYNPYAEYQEEAWFTKALESPNEVYVSSSRVENLVEGSYPWVISFSRAVRNDDGETVGVLLVDLSYDVIDVICGNVELGNRGYIFLVDSNEEILWHPKQKMINAGLMKEYVSEVLHGGPGPLSLSNGSTELLYFSRTSAATGWTAVGVAYAEELIQQQDLIFRQYVLIDLAAVALALLLSILISRAIANPIRKLAGTMEAVEQGDFSIRSDLHTRSEVGQLSDNFNHMLATIQSLMDEQLRNEEQKRQVEWNLLQAQIKPHFIYNTLDSIIWMSHAGHNEEVVEMASALAQMLRNSIGCGDEIITLDQELAHVESYLTIQKLRYREKLQFELDIEPNTRQCLLPKLVLQPLVENAIYHGIKVKQDGGTVRISSMLDEETLLITVEDDGVGMTPEQLQHIYDRKESDEASSKIGVYNVNERLHIYFGEEYGLKFFSEPEKGTTVMVILPQLRSGQQEEFHESSD